MLRQRSAGALPIAMAKASASAAKQTTTRQRREPAHVLLRLPGHTKDELDALRGLTGMSLSALVAEAVTRYVGALPAADRRLLQGVKARRDKTLGGGR